MPTWTLADGKLGCFQFHNNKSKTAVNILMCGLFLKDLHWVSNLLSLAAVGKLYKWWCSAEGLSFSSSLPPGFPPFLSVSVRKKKRNQSIKRFSFLGMLESPCRYQAPAITLLEKKKKKGSTFFYHVSGRNSISCDKEKGERASL